ncbi:MAG: lactate racemase domain-containing protein [Myxococcota bacterium]
MSHPCLVTIDSRSAPRTLFSGDRLVDVDLPTGTRVLYTKPPMKPLRDVDAAIRYAINHPENSEPLYGLLRPGMKVTIAIDDISLPLPPMRRPDVRERVLTIVLDLLTDHGVDDVEMIIATSVHRRMKAFEVRHMVGDRIFDKYWPDRLYNHDAEDAEQMVLIGTTEVGEEVELNRRAVESDLVIYVNLNLVPMDGGHKSVSVGLCGYRSLRAHHNPKVMRNCHSYMNPETSELNTSVTRMGRLTNEKLKVFTIETAINNNMFDRPLSFLAKPEDDLSATERVALRTLKATLERVPQPARQAIFQRVPSPYGVIAVHAGETEAVHAKILAKNFEQYCVPVQGQADILVSGIPYISPYNVNSFLNPLLVQCMADGYLFNLYRGLPMVKKGGTMIILHPCTDQFDNEHHAPYIEFVHRLLPITRDAMQLHQEFEPQFAKNPAYLEMFRTGHAYHPTHPFFMWYWGEAGRQHLGRMIVVGADNEYIPKLMGWETAQTMDEALRMAGSTAPPDPDILALHMPPIGMAEVSAPAGRPPASSRRW